MDKKIISSMRGIALDSINNAKGGHIGMALGASNITYALLMNNLNFWKDNPKWINRDRLVLSAGHGSMAIYSAYHFLGILTKEDMMNHKKWGSKTPSHPEIDKFDFVDASTGPLGQGVAMAVGMAISQEYLKEVFNKDNFNIFDHNIFAVCGDGDLQEGVALEAFQIAGTRKLNKLVVIHDFNEVQIDSTSKEVNNIDFKKYFESLNFNVLILENDEVEEINKAITFARKSDKPTYIQVRTQIAKFTDFENTSKGHHGILNEEKTIEFKKKLGLTSFTPFEYDQDVYQKAQTNWAKKEEEYLKWDKMFNEYKTSYPQDFEKLNKLISKDFKYSLDKVEISKSNVATREYIAEIISYLEENYFNFIGGSADLSAATKLKFSDPKRNIKYGIREFAMSAINNGINLDSNLRTIDSTFLSFADYLKSALRLGAIQKLNNIHIFTHDSYQVGGDGPTHQPIEQLTMLRSIPGVNVIRPCDESEMKFAFEKALNATEEQTIIIACRQNLKSFNILKDSFKAAYLIKDEKDFDLNILASGSEVELGEKVISRLLDKGIKARLISVPSLNDLLKDEMLIKELKLSEKPMYAIEASNDSMWYKLSKYNKFDMMQSSEYGESADGQMVYEKRGFSSETICDKIIDFLK